MHAKIPILITGSHRSGTTWVGKTISQHADVKYVQEPFNVSFPNNNLRLQLDTWFTDYHSSNQKEDIQSSFDELFESNPLKYSVKRCKSTGLDRKTPLRFAKYLLQKWFFGKRILVKDPIALLSAGWLYERYDLQVIVMIRNPLAFVGSLKKAGWDFDFENIRNQEILMQGRLNRYSSDIEYMCSQNGKNESDIVDKASLLWKILYFIILEYQAQYPEWLYVKHENISMKPETGFQAIFDFLELELNDEILKYIRQYTSKMNPREGDSTSYQPRDSKSSLQSWKERLTEEEMARVKETTKDIASHFYNMIDSGF